MFAEAQLDFRATKDIDIVLIVEALSKEFGIKFWEFVRDAEYEHVQKSTNLPEFYRFSKPKSKDYPFMIELFSRSRNLNEIDSTQQIVPLHVDDAVSSLPAILLNSDYYAFLTSGVKKINGISVLDAEHIIPFKSKAWLDLSARKRNGEHVDSRDIKKHRNDVLRLCVLLIRDQKIKLPETIKNDMIHFMSDLNDDINFKQLGLPFKNKEEIIDLLKDVYDI